MLLVTFRLELPPSVVGFRLRLELPANRSTICASRVVVPRVGWLLNSCSKSLCFVFGMFLSFVTFLPFANFRFFRAIRLRDHIILMCVVGVKRFERVLEICISVTIYL